jgi:kynurenine formamidase
MQVVIMVVMAAALALGSATVHAQSWTPPAESERCPSKWGAGDERGSANHMKPETVLRATRLIRTGEVIELGHVLSPSMPAVNAPGGAGRHFIMQLKPHRRNPGTNRRGTNEELVLLELGQVGTQLDGLAHGTVGDSLYNCHQLDDITTQNGYTKLGIHNVGALMTRGVMIDVAALKGVEILPAGYVITVDDLQQALARQKLTLQPGDAVIINTGEGRLWGKRADRKGQAGIGLAAGQWLARQDPMLIGADNSAVEASPGEDPKVNIPTHSIFLVVNGIHILERMKLDELATKRVYEFAFVIQPLKIQGGTGSTVAPIAIR